MPPKKKIVPDEEQVNETFDQFNTEEPCPAEKVKEKEKSNDSELVETLLQQIEKLNARLNEVEKTNLATSRYNDQTQKFGNAAMRREIKLSDKLERAKTFVTLGRGFVMSAYNIDGSEINAPYNVPIRFKWSSSDIRKTADGDVPIHYSTYETWSKSECEFIEQSPYFNRTIFDNVTRASKVDPTMVASIERATTLISNMTNEQLFASAIQYGLDKNSGVTKLRNSMIAIKVKEIMEHESKIANSNPALEHLIPSQG